MPDRLRAWHPAVPGVHEVLHARMDHHAYPPHTHDSWTLLLVDAGAVHDLGRHGHHAAPAVVTLLPFVPHDGRSAAPGTGFRKRVVYLDADWLPARAVGAAADSPTPSDPDAVSDAHALHAALETPADVLTAEHHLLALQATAGAHLGEMDAPPVPDTPLARRLRRLLDDRLTDTVTLADAALELGAHPAHLARSFARAYGIPPHRYVTGRRVDRARRLLLDGWAACRRRPRGGLLRPAALHPALPSSPRHDTGRHRRRPRLNVAPVNGATLAGSQSADPWARRDTSFHSSQVARRAS